MTRRTSPELCPSRLRSHVECIGHLPDHQNSSRSTNVSATLLLFKINAFISELGNMCRLTFWLHLPAVIRLVANDMGGAAVTRREASTINAYTRIHIHTQFYKHTLTYTHTAADPLGKGVLRICLLICMGQGSLSRMPGSISMALREVMCVSVCSVGDHDCSDSYRGSAI